MWWLSFALAGRPEAIRTQVAKGKVDKAVARCERWVANAADTEPTLREACAEALYSRAAEQDTYAGWVAYAVQWGGTKKAVVAREHEAAARLKQIGETAPVDVYSDFVEAYGDTVAGQTARTSQGAAAVRQIDSATSARHVARTFPDAPGLDEAIAPWFSSFIELEVDGEALEVRLRPQIRLHGQRLEVSWAASRNGEIVPWDIAAARHLEELAVPKRIAQSLGRAGSGTRYPPCTLHSDTLGVAVKARDQSGFVAHERSCGGAPVFFSVADGRLLGISMVPGLSNRLAAPGSTMVEHVLDDVRTRIPILGEPTAAVAAMGPLLSQKMGSVWLLHPLAGGLPWYAAASPRTSGPEVPQAALSVPVPEGVDFVGTSSGDVRVEFEGAPGSMRILPPGSARVLSPLLAETLGLNSKNPAFSLARPSVLPRDFEPEGRDPALLPKAEESALVGHLRPFAVQASRAWQVDLGSKVIVFEGLIRRQPVRGVLEVSDGTEPRLFVFEADGKSTDRPIVFEHGGVRWFGWSGDGTLEAVRFEAIGLVRSWTAAGPAQ